MIDVGPVEHRDAALIPRLHHHFTAGDRNERPVVRDTVFLSSLRGRHLVVRVEHQLVVLDRKERVGAPLHLVGLAAARRPASAPFIGEQNLLAVVAERRRMPERHVRIRGSVEPDRMRGIADVEKQAEPRAGAARQADLRVDRDVMALIRAGRRPRIAASGARRTSRTRRTSRRWTSRSRRTSGTRLPPMAALHEFSSEDLLRLPSDRRIQ